MVGLLLEKEIRTLIEEVNKTMSNPHFIGKHRHLAALVYDIALRKQIEERVESKYLKRIEHLVGANNELMHELEQCEKECYGRGV